MPSNTEITVSQLARLVGLPHAPTIVDVRMSDDVDDDPRLLPAAQRRDFQNVATWASGLDGGTVVVVCEDGGRISQGVAAWLRHSGVRAETLEGGFEARRAGCW